MCMSVIAMVQLCLIIDCSLCLPLTMSREGCDSITKRSLIKYTKYFLIKILIFFIFLLKT